MKFSATTWKRLTPEEQALALAAALIPPPISLDLWAKGAGTPSVKVLQLADQLIHSKIMKVYAPLGIGHYHYRDPETIPDILRWSGRKTTTVMAKRLLSVFESEYREGPSLWMALAYLYQTSGIEPKDTAVLIRAAEYCLGENLPDDAVAYYRLVVDSGPGRPDVHGAHRVYSDGVIGLCFFQGGAIPLRDQERLLTSALALLDANNNPNREVMILAGLGRVYQGLGDYEQAADNFDKAWNKALRSNSPNLVRHVALSSTDFLFWRGRLTDAIERYENVLGNLDSLPPDEPSLRACAQLGWIYGKCGQTNRGIGLINFVMEKAVDLKLDHLENYAKVRAINTLHDARRDAEAEPIIDELLAIPQDKLDAYLKWSLCAAKAYTLSCQGKYEESLKMQQEAYANAKSLGMLHHRGPINFDYMDALEDAGFVHPEMNYDSEVERVIHWPDLYMQGVGYYYRAKRTVKRNGPLAQAREDLRRSMELLDQSGARLDLAFSEVFMARLLMQAGQREQAEKLLRQAWGVMRFVNEKLFPEEFRPLVAKQDHQGYLLDPMIEISETLGTIRSRRELLNKMISLTMRMTGAERGGFFVPKNGHGIEMIASRNIEPDRFQMETESGAMASVIRVMKTGKETVQSKVSGSPALGAGNSDTSWRIAYPVTLQGSILGVFLLERNLGGFAVSERILSLLRAISTLVAVALDNVGAYEEIAELKDQLEAEALFYRGEPSNARQIKNIVGASQAIQDVVARINDVAHFDTTVLILGETGVGKELVAKAIHQLSDRTAGPFIPVSIASLSENLIPSELFGHEKGAFTNALRAHRGRFELANNGTLFLDEVNSLSLDIQRKLLRVLEERSCERVGGTTRINLNFRLIAASNQPLDRAVEKGAFRSDLYYRLNVYPIVVPPLRERREDIPLLVSHFVRQFNKKFGTNYKNINKRSLRALANYQWPGNVRELKHAVERAVISSKDKELIFPDYRTTDPVQEERVFLSFREMERQYIMKALARCGGKVSGKNGAAALLGLNPQTLYSKIKRLGIQKKGSMGIGSGQT